MDARKLRQISADAYVARKKKAQDLAAAIDDGFTAVQRDEILDLPLVIVGWETEEGFGGSKYSEVWALAEYSADGDVRKVKFQDGGRSADGITRTLARLVENGVTGDLVATLKGEPYSFKDDEGVEVYAMRYTLAGLEPEKSDPDF
jgi:hypothetical protein